MVLKLRGLALVVLGAAAAGCVSKGRYDQAVSAVNVEKEASRRATLRITEVNRKLADLEQRLRERESALGRRDQERAQIELDLAVVTKEREAAQELADQLRGELGRVGDHLRAFSAQKQELTTALEQAEQRVAKLDQDQERSLRTTRVMRDLALLLQEPVSTGKLTLDVSNGQPMLSVPNAHLFTRNAKSIDWRGVRVLKAVARLSALHPKVRFELSEPGTSGGEGATLLHLVGEKLGKLGLKAERVSFKPERTASPSSADTP
ncbi:MAG TPA: hypothetical protein VGJ84_18895, partial [Polyangiaceae bacterium]